MKPTVCLLTAYNSRYKDVAAITLGRMQALADAHDYSFRAIRRDDCDRQGGWIKIEPIVAALETDFDFILWVDIDALVVRKDLDIRDAVRDAADLQMVWHGPETSRLEVDSFEPHFNTGVMLIRVSPWARHFFARVWETGPVDHLWNDQATILNLLGYDGLLHLGEDNPDGPDRTHVARLDTTWNSIVGVAVTPDPVIHHYAGLDLSARLRLMQADRRTLDVREASGADVREAFAWQLGQWRNDTIRPHVVPPRALSRWIGRLGL
jgi:hypothetical protein